MTRAFPVLVVLLVIITGWYLACIPLNAAWTRDQAARAGVEVSFAQVIAASYDQERPVLPAPHQVAAELWNTTVMKAVTSKKSLVYHAWITDRKSVV